MYSKVAVYVIQYSLPTLLAYMYNNKHHLITQTVEIATQSVQRFWQLILLVSYKKKCLLTSNSIYLVCFLNI